MDTKIAEPISVNEKIQLLVDAMQTLHSTANSNGYSTMGFLIVVVGWLITSKEARRFLHSHPPVIYAGITIMFLISALYAYMAFGLQDISRKINTELDGIPAARGLYEHFLITTPAVLGFLIILGTVTIVIMAILWAISKDPALPTEATS